MGKDDTKHDPPKPEAEDPDRAAILARRQRFIAIALSGLATGSACTKPAPCLNVAPVEPESGHDGEPDATPQPCLEVAAPPEPEPEPRPEPCLKVAAPEPDASTTAAADDAPATDAAPRPCLKVRPPEEPKPKPQPCLRVAPPRDQPPEEPKPKPQPCLRVADPE